MDLIVASEARAKSQARRRELNEQKFAGLIKQVEYSVSKEINEGNKSTVIYLEQYGYPLVYDFSPVIEEIESFGYKVEMLEDGLMKIIWG